MGIEDTQGSSVRARRHPPNPISHEEREGASSRETHPTAKGTAASLRRCHRRSLHGVWVHGSGCTADGSAIRRYRDRGTVLRNRSEEIPITTILTRGQVRAKASTLKCG